MRELSVYEGQNIAFLEDCGFLHAEVHLTTNIIKHAIFDATKSIKEVLKKGGIHDYDDQKNGVENKLVIESHLITFLCDIPGTTSLYRAGTRGDCRMWFGSEIFPLCQPDDVCSIIPINHELYVVNLTHMLLEDCVSCTIPNPFKSIVSKYCNKPELI